MAGGLTRKSALRLQEDETERRLKQERITRAEAERESWRKGKRQPLRKPLPQNCNRPAKRNKTTGVTEVIEETNHEVNEDLESHISHNGSAQDSNRQCKEGLHQSTGSTIHNKVHLENLSRVTEESQKENQGLSKQSKTLSVPREDDISGLTSVSTGNSTFTENEAIFLTGELEARWKLQEKPLKASLISIVKIPKWFGRFKFATDRVCASIIKESLENKTIACTQGLNSYQFGCVATKKILYRVFNDIRHGIETKMKAQYMSKC